MVIHLKNMVKHFFLNFIFPMNLLHRRRRALPPDRNFPMFVDTKKEGTIPLNFSTTIPIVRLLICRVRQPSERIRFHQCGIFQHDHVHLRPRLESPLW